MSDDLVEPSDVERGEWPDATRDYVWHLEQKAARITAQAAEIARLRGVVKHWPTRSDYDSDRAFIDASFNWETQQARAALAQGEG